ncbi:MAG: hypothetical protein U0234_07645 [Sandaracinus sp.]
MTSSLEILLRDPGNVFARVDGVLIQVRCGAIGVALIDRISEEVQRLLRAWGERPSGFIAVLEPTAETVSLAVRERQRRIVRATESQGDVKMAMVVVGDGVAAALSRSIARTIMIRHQKLKVVADVDEAARWVAPHVGAGVAETARAVQTVRRLLVAER